MDVNGYYKIGFILKPHGLKGGVTVSLDDNGPEDLSTLDSLFIEKNKRLVPYFIESISVRGDKAFVKLEDVDTPEASKAVSKCAVYLPKSTRPKSGRGEFYDDEVVGFEVIDEELGSLGKVFEVAQAGPNRLLAVDHDGKEVLIPINSPFIISVNKSKKKITVQLPDGFLDI
ncbi:MAG: ribosome maturation factor RimM [Bacteroidota bacterium]